MDDLVNLLDLHGEVFPMDNGYWIKFEAYEVEPSKSVPHGVRYSLTLHDKNNHRVIGYDNAHSFKSSKNIVQKKSLMITYINRWILWHMSLSQHLNYLKIFGKQLNTTWRTTNENENNKSWHHVNGTIQTKDYEYR